MYGLIGLFWMVLPAAYAYFGGKDVGVPDVQRLVTAVLAG